MAAWPTWGPAQRSCSEFLYWIKAARLRRSARWRPGAAAAPCLRHRSGGPHPLSAQPRRGGQPDRRATDHSEHQGQADTHQARPRRPTAHRSVPYGPQSRSPRPVDKPRWQRPGRSVAQAVTYGSSVAGAGTGLLETHVTDDRSAHPSPWLTFGGSGQDPSPTRQSGAKVAAVPASEHANCPGTIGTGVLIRASATGPPGMLSRLTGGPVIRLSAWAVRAAP